MLSQNLKKVLFHVPESQEPKKMFRIFLSSDAFHYLCFKVNESSVIKTSMRRRQRIIKYYDTLKTESGTRVNNIVNLRILTKPALESLRQVLVICTIGSLLSSVECLPQLPPDVAARPTKPIGCNGIDFFYTYETQSLLCTVRFSKLPIVTADVATSRISAAHMWQ